MYGGQGGYGQRGRPIGCGLLIAVLMAAFALFQYYGSSSVNTVTGQKQHVAGITPNQEIALGLHAAPQMEQQYGGESQDARLTGIVQSVGQKVVQGSDAAKTPYQYQFHLLADTKTINAFALPGGQVFMTEALARHLRTEGQFAAVLGHEVGHVVARHSAQQLAKQQLSQGLTGAAVLATYDPNDPKSYANAAIIQAISSLVNLRFSRNDELQADQLGVRLMSEAGYDPRAMLQVMEILKQSGGPNGPEFFSTHPSPDHREERIKQDIAQVFPHGVPAGLKP